MKRNHGERTHGELLAAAAALATLLAAGDMPLAGAACTKVVTAEALHARIDSAFLGWSVAAVPDLDGDGIGEFLVGAYGDRGVGPRTGRAYLHSGADRSRLCVLQDPDGLPDVEFGRSVATLDDVNGDAVPDLAVGSPVRNSVFLYSGRDCSLIERLRDPAADAGDRFGETVTRLGDVTGDGIADFAVGASKGGGSFEGWVLVFSGAGRTPVHRLVDPQGGFGDGFGGAIADVGDLTGDGFPEIGVGAPGSDGPGGIDAGTAVVFSGLDGSVLFRLVASNGVPSENLGASVAPFGDFDNDGVRDIAVGAPGWNGSSLREGSVVVFSGARGSALIRLVDPFTTGKQQLGSALIAVSDRNGDGVADLAAGAVSDPSAPAEGRVVFFDGESGLYLERILDPSRDRDARFGQSIAELDDFSGDGTREMLVGAPHTNSIELNRGGVAYVLAVEDDCDGDLQGVYGGDCDDNDADRRSGKAETCDGKDNDCDGLVDGDGDGDGIGVCTDCEPANPAIHPGAPERCNNRDDDCDGLVDEGPDIDGDGRAAPCDCDDDAPAVWPGAAEVCNRVDDDCDGEIDETAPELVPSRQAVPVSGDDQQRYGSAVAAIGDVTGDLLPDLLVGAPRYMTRGRAFVISGADMSEVCELQDPTASGFDNYGAAVAGLDDLNGDGVPDFAVGSGTGSGRVFVYSGSDCALLRQLRDPDSSFDADAGASIAGVHDVDGDGVGDVMVGAPSDRIDGLGRGSAAVFSGASGVRLFRMTDPLGGGGDRLGASVAAIGDVNADGLPDLAVGAPGDSFRFAQDHGSVLLFSGTDGAFVRKLRATDSVASDQLGHIVIGLPDVTGDGVPDVAAGVPFRDEAGARNRGSVAILSGRSGGLVRRLLDPRGGDGWYFGYSVAPYRDMTGDGVPELIVGAPGAGFPAGSSVTGSRLLVMDPTDGRVLRFLEDPEGGFLSRLGWSVTTLGDIAGGRVPEIAAGAPSAPTPQPRAAGKLLVFAFEADCDGDGAGPSGGDCDDTDALRGPGQVELCDGRDNDCDTDVDEDSDGDGFAACEDCAPGSRSVHPAAIEVCNNLDDDCNGSVDDGADLDFDGYSTPCDCADGDDTRNPGVVETCNYVDDDCDLRVDEGTSTAAVGVLLYDPKQPLLTGFGKAVAAVGDVTGDGVPDFAVGADEDNIGNWPSAGSVAVFSGADLSFHCRLTDPDGSYTNYLGAAVAGIGDISGDGVPDIAAGAWGFEDRRTPRSGKVVVFSGASCSRLRSVTDPDAETLYLGMSLAPFPDVTGDGKPDLLAGGGGKVRVISPWSSRVLEFTDHRGNPIAYLRDPLSADFREDSIAAVDDVDGDGVPEILLGLPTDQRWAFQAGVVVLLSGGDGRLLRRFTDPAPAREQSLGASVAGIGDLSGDGVPDVVAGEPGYENDRGAVLVFSGSDGRLLRRLVDVTGSSARLGESVAALPDLTGDGVQEILAGAPSPTGGLLVFDGASGSVLERFRDSAVSRQMGSSVASPGDLTGDGVADFVAGGRESIAVLTVESDCDGDGYTAFVGECDDSDAGIHPGRFDFCGDGIDDDCVPGDGSGEPWFDTPCDGPDGDLCIEGRQECLGGVQACSDTSADSVEVCSGRDDDCNGAIDDVSCARFEVDGNERIDGLELNWLGRAFGSCSANPAGEWWGPVDYNADGCVDGHDLALLANLWGRSCSGGAVLCP